MIPPFVYDILGSNVEVGAAAVAVVLTGIAVRIYFGSVIFHPSHTLTWNAARRILVPILQRVVYVYLPFDIAIENESKAEEYAATVDTQPDTLALKVDEVREVEIPLLSGCKTDPDGRTERATFVWYVGPKPFTSAPRWLRRYQVHPTVFKNDDGTYDVYAHFEANSYRPDLWADHLFKGPSFSVKKGVDRTQNAFDDAEIEWNHEPPEAA